MPLRHLSWYMLGICLGIRLDGNSSNWHIGSGRRSQFDEECCDFTLISYDITTWNFICKAF